MTTPACVHALVRILDEFIDDGAYGFARGLGVAPELLVVGFAEVNGDAGHSDLNIWQPYHITV